MSFWTARVLIGSSCPVMTKGHPFGRNLVPGAVVLSVRLFLTGQVLFGLPFQIPVRAHGWKQRLKSFYNVRMLVGNIVYLNRVGLQIVKSQLRG